MKSLVRRSVLLISVLAGCGARTGLGLPPDDHAPPDADTSEVDAASDTRTDTTIAFDASVDSDAPVDADATTIDVLPDVVIPDAVLPDVVVEDVLALEAPRAIAPLSTMRTTTRRPTFRWLNAAGESGARVEICADRTCSSILTTFDAIGSTARSPRELPKGVVFWRLRAIRSGAIGSKTSPVWELLIPGRSAPIESASGALADFDGDGRGDVAVVFEGLDSSVHVRVHLAGAAVPSFDASLSTPPDFETPAIDVAPAGDLDGDGIGDLVVADDVVYVFPGPPSSARPPAIVSLTLGAGDNIVHVSSAGDVNGDGYGDLLFSVQGRAGDYVELHRGSAVGIDPTAAWRYDRESGGPYTSVSGSCDFDADGFSDFVVPRATQSLVYRGGLAGPTLFATTVAPTALRVCANDVDGDGYADFWGRALSPGDTALSPYLFYGGPAGPHAPRSFSTAETTELSSGGDFDGDGLLDLVVRNGDGSVYLSAGAPLVGGLPTERVSGPSPPGFAEHVAAIGDVDGDAFDDAAFTGGAFVFVFRGTPTGFGETPWWTPWRTIDETSVALRIGAIATSR